MYNMYNMMVGTVLFLHLDICKKAGVKLENKWYEYVPSAVAMSQNN
jgi:hypothetical protein